MLYEVITVAGVPQRSTIHRMSRRGKYWRWRYLRYALLSAALLVAGFVLYLDFRVRTEFEGRRFALPARIYARPLELHAGLV